MKPIEIWERLRGYNKWIPAVATVQSSTLAPIRFNDVEAGTDGNKQAIAWEAVCKIVWDDRHCTRHTAEFEVFEESPLYQLTDGDTVSIRFNPDKPEEFYVPGLIQSSVARAWKLGIWAVLIILVIVGFVVVWFGPNALSH
jgi:hypothetical protein